MSGVVVSARIPATLRADRLQVAAQGLLGVVRVLPLQDTRPSRRRQRARRSASFIDQYQISSAPCWYFSGVKSYQPLSPYMCG